MEFKRSTSSHGGYSYTPAMSCPFLTFCWLSVLAQAYIIDDSNITIQYSTHWQHHVNASVINVDNTRLFNATFSDGYCVTGDGCNIRIPFTGSGITIYNLIFRGLNASFAVDGGSPKTYLHDWSCIDIGCYNVSVYNVQSLTLGTHTLDIALFSYTDNHYSSDFVFDYAVVNDTDIVFATVPSPTTDISPSTTVMPASTISSPTIPTPSLMPSPMPSPTSPATSSSTSRKPLANAIGGSFGGLAAIAAIALALRYLWKRKYSQISKNIPASALIIDPLPPPVTSQSMPLTSPLPTGTEMQEQTTIPFMPTLNMYHKGTTSGHISTVPMSAPPAAQESMSSNASAIIEVERPAPALPAPVPEPISPSHGLTELQVDSIQRLLMQNVPGPIVATVMESMLTREELPTASGNGLMPRTDVLLVSETEPPPAYNDL